MGFKPKQKVYQTEKGVTEDVGTILLQNQGKTVHLTIGQ